MGESKSKIRIGLGVCGGIAAYKAIEVLRLLQKAGCEVSVAMTRHATEFVKPLTFRALTGGYVLVDDYDESNPDPIAHINFSQNIDLLLIVPATANVLAKLANGIADDFLTSTYLASNAPVLVAPAMNVTMWEQPATRRNVAQLKKDGVRFVEPIAGELACKTVGTGKLEDVENIARQALDLLNIEPAKPDAAKSAAQNPKSKIPNPKSKDLGNEHILLTVGGTREAIDPVRFISNHSSGKMGFALAEAARDRGAWVTCVCGSVSVDPPEGVEVIRAESAEQMLNEVLKYLSGATVFIGAAAVADYRPKRVAESKIKKTDADELVLELERTPDILSTVAEIRNSRLLVVGFAAETNNVEGYARSKMERKRLDMIVANDVSDKGLGFGSEENAAILLTPSGSTTLPRQSKREMADKILDAIADLRASK
ncbi:MAG: bifunctional phosphopantothenoylcysteine decarboxylase/phosphopantothenate--cysteine ligase CoaBC [Acidobacteria bacterium]|nr:bifunctional phosphopantothenoylcysteine decarboxylase/phosphopantothenate--cysteine ligase CoaBC [Acidobacteriota bacterium]